MQLGPLHEQAQTLAVLDALVRWIDWCTLTGCPALPCRVPQCSKSLGKAWVPNKLLNKLTSRGRSDSQSIFEKVC